MAKFSGREKGLLVVAIAAVLAAIVGFALYASALVPSNAAAKVDDSYITEDAVEAWIDQYRVTYGLDEDEDFASYLLSAGYNVSTFRQNAINQLALNAVIVKRGEELGVEISDEDIDAQIEAAKELYAFGDEETWVETLEALALTEDDLREQYKVNLYETAICAAEVEEQEASDDDVLSYINTYLLGTTQKHVYRIIFEDYDTASAVQAELAELAEAGQLTTEVFSAYAIEYSTEEDVEETGGSYAWSGADMGDYIKEILEYMEVGELSEVESVTDDDDAQEVIFCDAEYTFPTGDDDGELTAIPEDIDEELLADVTSSTESALFETASSNYLAELLAAAQITYYPMPEDAPYNVDMTTSSSSEAVTEEE